MDAALIVSLPVCTVIKTAVQSPKQTDTKIPKTCSSIYFDLYDLQL